MKIIANQDELDIYKQSASQKEARCIKTAEEQLKTAVLFLRSDNKEDIQMHDAKSACENSITQFTNAGITYLIPFIVLGRIYCKAEWCKLAVENFTFAIEKIKQQPERNLWLYYWRARAYVGLGNIDKTAEDYAKLLLMMQHKNGLKVISDADYCRLWGVNSAIWSHPKELDIWLEKYKALGECVEQQFSKYDIEFLQAISKKLDNPPANSTEKSRAMDFVKRHIGFKEAASTAIYDFG